MNPLRFSTAASLFAIAAVMSACGMTPKAAPPMAEPTAAPVAMPSHPALPPETMRPMTPGAMSARLSGASEVPAVVSAANGMVEATFNPQTSMLNWTITYTGLSGPATAAHFHGPAMAGTNAGVALPITGPLASPIKGSAVLTAAQVTDLMAGKWYVNMHTAANPGGEIRGQVATTP